MSFKRPSIKYKYDRDFKKNRFNESTHHPILPVFEPSGLLELESNQKNGIQLKHVEPSDAIAPRKYYENRKIPEWERQRYEVFVYRKGVKGEISKVSLSEKSCYIVGRKMGRKKNKVIKQEMEQEDEETVIADITIPEELCSKEHCAIQFRLVKERLVAYLIDLDSSNGTTLNDEIIPSARYIELKNGDIINVSEEPEDTEFDIIFIVA